MQDIIKTITDNPLVQMGGFLLGVIGIVLAIIFYIRSRRIAIVRFDYSGRSLVEGLSGALEGIEVRYKGSPQDRITVSRFVFWNAGTETLRSSDFTDDHLRVACKQDLAILDHRIVKINDSTNKIEVNSVHNGKTESSVAIKFDYLDPNDGAIIQFVHNGPEQTSFRLVGSLKGNCSIERSESPAYRMARIYRSVPIVGPLLGTMQKSRIFGWLGALAYLVIGVAALVAPFRGGSWWLLFLAAFGFFGSWVMIMSFATGQVPNHFQRDFGSLPSANTLLNATPK